MKFFSLRPVANRIAILTACAVFLLAPGLLAAQSPAWTPIGPFGGTVGSLAVHPRVPGVLYAAGVLDGVLKSTDGGLSWQLLPGSPAAGLVVMDPTRPDTLYAVSRFPENRVFKSTDAGAHWAVVSRNLPVSSALPFLRSVPPSLRPVLPSLIRHSPLFVRFRRREGRSRPREGNDARRGGEARSAG